MIDIQSKSDELLEFLSTFQIIYLPIPLPSPEILIYEKDKVIRKKKLENSKHSINNKNQKEMGKLVEGIKVAAYVAEIIVAGSVVAELVSKWDERRKLKAAASVKSVVDETAEAA